MKVISYSLWGDKLLYLHGALVNAAQTKEFFPDWDMWIYYDDSVPIETIQKLQEFSHITCIRVDDGSYGMFWRFRALFENDLEAVLIRDLDSRITWRDVRCVTEWMESPFRLSVIRDHEEHYKVPILGGLFGIKGGPLPQELIPIMNEYSKIHKYNIDQVFLHDFVWPLLIQTRMEHGFFELEWMAKSRTDTEHMGRGYTIDETPRTDH
jgi:hypothetical protein